ncbi:MAG: transketolase [Candidatus Thermoplasmatota archaeon]|nr:transketolase [Candidatus Thermoplasmatota archaeon]
MRLHNRTHTSHIGSEFSSLDIMVELYFDVMDITPQNFSSLDRDYFIISKGHAAPALYDVLFRRGFITKDAFESYGKEGSQLAEHPKREVFGVDTATGSLGHGLSIAAGMAYSLKYSNMKGKVYCLLSDGECQEGSTIEAANFAGRMKLDNLIAVIDNNRLQGYERTSNIQNIASVKNKFEASSWSVSEMNGHDFQDMRSKFLNTPFKTGEPSLLIANTLKGKGVLEMEDKLEWHYKSPSDVEVENFIKQLGGST